ncbi:hypothetical protein OENI_10062 [Oenococcus oeni]|nr:hypothetical protein OENI_10062 [Oenococcus oeni]
MTEKALMDRIRVKHFSRISIPHEIFIQFLKNFLYKTKVALELNLYVTFNVLDKS